MFDFNECNYFNKHCITLQTMHDVSTLARFMCVDKPHEFMIFFVKMFKCKFKITFNAS